MVHKIRGRIAEGVLAADLSFLEKMGSAALATTFHEDLAPITNAVVNIPYMFVNIVITVGCVLYLGWLSWLSMVGIVLCVGAGAATYYIAIKWANRWLRKARRQQELLASGISILVNGIKEQKLNKAKQAYVRDLLVDMPSQAV